MRKYREANKEKLALYMKDYHKRRREQKKLLFTLHHEPNIHREPNTQTLANQAN